MSESDPKPSQPSLARDAIIFIPAIDTTWTDQSIELISQKLVTALDRNAKTPEARFKSEVRYEDYGANTKKRVCTIKRTDDGNDIQVLDIYDMGYSQLLRKPFENRSLFVKALLVFLAIIKSVPLLITAFRKKSKTVREKMQLGFAALILGLLGAYMFLLLVAAGGVVIQGMRGWKGPPLSTRQNSSQAATPAATPTAPNPQTVAVQSQPRTRIAFNRVWEYLKWLVSWLVSIAPSMVVLLTTIGLLAPGKLRQGITDSATLYVCLIDYIDLGERRDVLSGQLQDLIEHVAERRKELKTRNIHIIAYSFGSIIAIDTLFPFESEPGVRLAEINTLATIGCPFDVIRTFWPAYFTHRRELQGVPTKWFNVFSPVDVLSSNFRNEDDPKVQTVEVEKEHSDKSPGKPAGAKPQNILYTVGTYKKDLTFSDILFLEGFRNHSLYWKPEADGEANCFSDLMQKIYAGDPVLG